MAWLCWPPPACPGSDKAFWREAAAALDEQPLKPLDYAEAFAGTGAVHRALAAFGLEGRAMDLKYSPDHNVLKPVGMLLLLETAMALKPGGIFWAAPPCSSWVFLSRSSTGRHLQVEGDVALRSVVAQNALVERLVLVLEILALRGVFWIVEQPASSCMWDYPAMRSLRERHGLQPRLLDMGAYGGTSQKPTHLLGTAPYLKYLGRRCSPSLRLRLRLEGVQTTRRWEDADGKKRCQATKECKATEHYPEGWGAAHALAFVRHSSNAAGATSRATRTRGAAELGDLLERLPPELKAATAGAWWLRDFLGEPW